MASTHTRSVFTALICAASLSFAACSGSGGNSSSVIPGGGSKLVNLYIGSFTGGALGQYSPPFSASTAPNFEYTGQGYLGVASDSKWLAAAFDASSVCTIDMETQPVTSSSTPAAVITPGATCELASFDSSGNYWIALDNNTVAEYTPPFTSGQTAAMTVSTDVSSPVGVAFDGSNNLYVVNELTNPAQLLVFAPPYTGTPTVLALPVGNPSEAVGVAVSGSTVAVGVLESAVGAKPHITSGGGSQSIIRRVPWSQMPHLGGHIGKGVLLGGEVLIYTTPITSSSSPAATITEPTSEAVAFDPAGDLYVGDSSVPSGTGGVLVFTPPLSSSSVYAFAITDEVDEPAAINFGP